jgi:hypothetical protein
VLNAARSAVPHAAAAIAFGCLACVLNASAVERIGVTDIKPLLVAALDRGEAHGVLVGEPAQWIAQHFRTNAPIEIDVKTVKALSRPGCMRLAITTAQDGVWDYNREQRAREPERKAFTWMVNYCRDGSLPDAEAK